MIPKDRFGTLSGHLVSLILCYVKYKQRSSTKKQRSRHDSCFFSELVG